MCHILGLVIGCVEIVASAGEASLHDGQVLVGECKVYDQLRLVVAKQ